MGEDASLDDFLTASESEESDDEPSESTGDGETAPEEAEPADTAAEAEPDDGATAADDSEPAPATTTYAWDGAGATCAACGESVERRWQQDGELVCATCKDWERP